jgi:ferric-dicitrate binding protein FerR (iron transport regulator)
MNSKEFKHILDQYTTGSLDGQQQKQLEAWLDSLEDKTAFDSLPPDELDAARDAMYDRLLHRIDNNRRVFIPGLRVYKVAAAIAVLIVAGYAVFNLAATHRKTVAASMKGGITKQILSDGTIVWLKGESRLTYPVKFSSAERTVVLEGEALFEVAKDARHPFLIHCGSLTTQVLGTSFNIRRVGHEVAISVLTGAVSLNGNRILREHENAVYSEVQATVTTGHATTEAVHEFTKGTEYNMAFNDARMQEVIQRIEKKFEVDIQTRDTAIANNLFTADLTDQSLQTTMEMISQVLNLEVTIKGKTIFMQPK